MEDQCERCLDALQERRDTHSKACDQREKWYLQMWSPNDYVKISNVNLKFASILEPSNGKVHIKA